MPDDSVDLKYDAVIHRTEKAVLLLFGAEEAWVPLSVIDDPEDLDEDGGEVGVQYWFVEKEGLEGYEV